ncbi:helix-turn-helix domain-containing protein [Caenibius sp. WL]|uniref:helix-turn-helix transcriptional regulator n=1 Tax=Caenibius sp. WL TaxID=2872646 RepID=UPI001C98EF0A|nr:helix-turn-helix domain-containing protein [Caenibius sp. WL]QZP07091.1 helix-turn-helix domain-containing protein [Caenibius sp. WL]
MSEQDDLLTSAETAALLGIKTNTLEIWRTKGHGPAFLKLGTAPQAPVRYRPSEVTAWLEQRLYASTSAYTAALASIKQHNRSSSDASA